MFLGNIAFQSQVFRTQYRYTKFWWPIVPVLAVSSLVYHQAALANRPDSIESQVSPVAQTAPQPPPIPSSDPNRDRFPQPSPVEPLPETLEDEPVLSPPPLEETPQPPAPSMSFPVTRIEVMGSTLFDNTEFDPIIQPLEGSTVTLEELRQAAQAITQLYLDRGYLTSRALLVDQPITDGVVQIRIIEGSIERIEIEGNRQTNPNYIRRRIAPATDTPLNSPRLEEELRLLQTNSLFDRVEASLRPGTEIGQSVLVVRVSETKPFGGVVFFDNNSPPSVGSERYGMGLRYRNLTGWGDEINLSYSRTTTGGADILDFNYRIPVNAKDGTVAVRISPTWNQITESPFEELDISGNSQLYEISFRQPLARSLQQEFALSVGFAHQQGQTFLFDDPFGFGIGPDEDGNSYTSVIKFGQDYTYRDTTGVWSLRSQFSLGTGLFDATSNSGSIPDGHFFSWSGQVQRLQRFGERHLLIVQGDLQLTPDSLLPSQQFVIGGGQSLRGYRQNVRSGDNGFRLSVEDRISVVRNAENGTVLQLIPFIDMGAVWNHGDNPNQLPRQNFLASTGLGLIWQPFPGLNLRLDYGYPIVDLDNRRNNLQDNGFHFSLSYQF
ncbi:ShlB/FhaC/HecB family hemolysin secretion/activation protein [Roseofilum sp. BLCC_M91]|uniref:ShlB/FhaC/HecB family hemolysin secretion/activation protein n=1 Tax=Roseofilum halophilum BLCC-M91 TaxID=3022259 RepID=A0ABT7BM29_9CYAN|nr:ShlB/FhaC/HecB family hemolysin secretion/activation protein [Roseofilum halophilum]MDJ1180238.1 ShlB/FhaC/HecB family hemolysin secretion/activation protein [Roseofilum halophilum BLCC-M91]